jgi:hypothetical protein
MTTAVTRITPCPPGFSDHVFKVDHGVELPLRIWPAPDGKKNAPWLLWFHGGMSFYFCSVSKADSIQVVSSLVNMSSLSVLFHKSEA